MKPTLLFATLSMVFASPTAFAQSELELLRAKCAEQERQIEQLEQENSRLRSDSGPSRSLRSGTELISASAAKPAAVPTTAAAVTASYTVKPGDSFEKIARISGTTPATIAKLNGLKRDAMIHPGQKLKVPGSPGSDPVPTPAAASSSLAGQTHTVKTGETYYSISRKYKVSVDSLIAANPKVKATAMRAGQVIRLGPSLPSASAAAPAPVTQTTNQVAQSIPSAREDEAPAEIPSPAPERKIRPVTIDGEMTYGDFAEKYGTNADRLNALNGLDLNNTTVLAKGSELYVPIAQP